MQITNDVDYDSSSASEDEDETPNDVGRSNKRKYCDDDPSNPNNPTHDPFTEAPVTSPLAAMQSTVITTAGST